MGKHIWVPLHDPWLQRELYARWACDNCFRFSWVRHQKGACVWPVAVNWVGEATWEPARA